MLNIAVIYGGRSCERDISVITAIQAMNMLDRSRYNVYPLLLGTEGGIFMPDKADDVHTYITDKKDIGKRVYIDGTGIYRKTAGIIRKIADIDCALVCTHGGEGENGILQGFLQLNGIPYTCTGVEASAVCMNKATSKVLFASMGIEVLPAIRLRRGDEPEGEKYAEKTGYPVIVKPLSQGSSIGITVAADKSQLEEGMALAFSFGDEILIERALTDFKEINCACVMSRGELIISSPERPVCWSEFLTFEDKYLGNGKINAGAREFPAVISERLADDIRKYAGKVYTRLNMKGVVRMDFLIDNKEDKVYLNEVNTVPGSLAYYLFTDKGIDGNRLMDILISEAVDSKPDKTPVYDSGVLDTYGKSGANACKTGAKHI